MQEKNNNTQLPYLPENGQVEQGEFLPVGYAKCGPCHGANSWEVQNLLRYAWSDHKNDREYMGVKGRWTNFRLILGPQSNIPHPSLPQLSGKTVVLSVTGSNWYNSAENDGNGADSEGLYAVNMCGSDKNIKTGLAAIDAAAVALGIITAGVGSVVAAIIPLLSGLISNCVMICAVADWEPDVVPGIPNKKMAWIIGGVVILIIAGILIYVFTRK